MLDDAEYPDMDSNAMTLQACALHCDASLSCMSRVSVTSNTEVVSEHEARVNPGTDRVQPGSLNVRTMHADGTVQSQRRITEGTDGLNIELHSSRMWRTTKPVAT